MYTLNKLNDRRIPNENSCYRSVIHRRRTLAAADTWTGANITVRSC